jgi:hypothetical protein
MDGQLAEWLMHLAFIPIDPGSNLGQDKIYSDSVCIEFELKFVGHYLLSIIH